MERTCSGHKVVPLKEEEMSEKMKDFKGYQGEEMVRLQPGGWLFPSSFTRFCDKIYNFKVKPEDVFIVAWPKCGTTWTQEIVWTMRNNPKLDNPLANSPMSARVYFLEYDVFRSSKQHGPVSPDHPTMVLFRKMCPGKNSQDGIYLQICEAAHEPRTIKSHLPLSLLPPDLTKEAKVIYVARNPKDVVISFYHHCRMFKRHSYEGSFEDFVKYFTEDAMVYGPYWLNVKEAWERKDDPNLHFILYEDLQSDNMEELIKLNKFLGTQLSSEQLEKIAHYTSFSQMKKRNHAIFDISYPHIINLEVAERDGGFFRKGEVGDWKTKYTQDLEAKMDSWIEKHLQNIGISFKYTA